MPIYDVNDFSLSAHPPSVHRLVKRARSGSGALFFLGYPMRSAVDRVRAGRLRAPASRLNQRTDKGERNSRGYCAIAICATRNFAKDGPVAGERKRGKMNLLLM